MRRYGPEAAKDIWDAPTSGIERIVGGIKKYNIDCGLLEQDLLFLGLGKHGKEEVESEGESRKSIRLTDQTIYEGDALKRVLGGEGYAAGIRYTGTYGVNPLLCLQGYKDVLIDNGMQVFESTEGSCLKATPPLRAVAASRPITSSSPSTSSRKI